MLEITPDALADFFIVSLPQSALGAKTPIQAMQEWSRSNPELFHHMPYDHPGCDKHGV